jgi:manganese transport protein
VVPLVLFTGERRKMGEFANGRLLSAVGWSVAVAIVGLNGWLLFQTALEWL